MRRMLQEHIPLPYVNKCEECFRSTFLSPMLTNAKNASGAHSSPLCKQMRRVPEHIPLPYGGLHGMINRSRRESEQLALIYNLMVSQIKVVASNVLPAGGAHSLRPDS